MWGERKEGRSLAPSTPSHPMQMTVASGASSPGTRRDQPSTSPPCTLSSCSYFLLSSLSPRPPSSKSHSQRPLPHRHQLSSPGGAGSRQAPPLHTHGQLSSVSNSNSVSPTNLKTRSHQESGSVPSVGRGPHRCKPPEHLPGAGGGGCPTQASALLPSQGAVPPQDPLLPDSDSCPRLLAAWKTTTMVTTRILIPAIRVTVALLHANHVADHAQHLRAGSPLLETIWELRLL